LGVGNGSASTPDHRSLALAASLAAKTIRLGDKRSAD
jgi:hypothetical protein